MTFEEKKIMELKNKEFFNELKFKTRDLLVEFAKKTMSEAIICGMQRMASKITSTIDCELK